MSPVAKKPRSAKLYAKCDNKQEKQKKAKKKD